MREEYFVPEIETWYVPPAQDYSTMRIVNLWCCEKSCSNRQLTTQLLTALLGSSSQCQVSSNITHGSIPLGHVGVVANLLRQLLFTRCLLTCLTWVVARYNISTSKSINKNTFKICISQRHLHVFANGRVQYFFN